MCLGVGGPAQKACPPVVSTGGVLGAALCFGKENCFPPSFGYCWSFKSLLWVSSLWVASGFQSQRSRMEMTASARGSSGFTRAGPGELSGAVGEEPVFLLLLWPRPVPSSLAGLGATLFNHLPSLSPTSSSSCLVYPLPHPWNYRPVSM